MELIITLPSYLWEGNYYLQGSPEEIMGRSRLRMADKSSGIRWRVSSLPLGDVAPDPWGKRLPFRGKPGSSDPKRPVVHSGHVDCPGISSKQWQYQSFASNQPDSLHSYQPNRVIECGRSNRFARCASRENFSYSNPTRIRFKGGNRLFACQLAGTYPASGP